MPLIKLADYYPNYTEVLDGHDIKKLDLYTQGGEKVGSVNDVLVEDGGRFRYLVIDMGAWGFSKKILLPIGLAHIDYNQNRIFVDGLSKEQVANLPEYNESITVDYDYEERLRGVYRPIASGESSVASGSYNRDNYNYEQEPNLYNINQGDRQTLRLYEERLITSKERHKAGEVSFGKHIETETARVSVPVEKERVIIERKIPTGDTPVNPDNVDFREGEVARLELYEETANIQKQAFVREEINIRKEVDRQTVDAEETLRREELDINPQGNLNVDSRDRI